MYTHTNAHVAAEVPPAPPCSNRCDPSWGYEDFWWKNVKLCAHTVHINDLIYGDNALSKVKESKIGNSLITSFVAFLP